MRSKGYNPSVLKKRIRQTGQGGPSSPPTDRSNKPNWEGGGVKAVQDNLHKGSEWPARAEALKKRFTSRDDWEDAGKTGKRPDHSFTQGPPSFAKGPKNKPRGGTPVKALKPIKGDFLNRGKSKKPLASSSPRANALVKRLNKR